MRLPTFREISRDEQQLKIYNARSKRSVFVVGPPGSGKTVLSIRRAQLSARDRVVVRIITYNRMLRRLIFQITDGGQEARTMHMFVSKHYWSQTGAWSPMESEYNFDWKEMRNALKKRHIVPKSVHVIVDEGQDLPKEFFRYLRKFVASTISVFADEDQAITKARSTLLDIKQAGELPDPVMLKYNHRNTPEVARLAMFYHQGSVPVAEVKRRESGELPKIQLYQGEGAMDVIAAWYEARGGRVGVAIVRNCVGTTICSGLRKRLPDARIDFYSNDQRNEDEIDLLAEGITVLNVQSIKGQEFNAVFVLQIGLLLRDFDEVKRRRMYMLCARARDHLVLMHEGDHFP